MVDGVTALGIAGAATILAAWVWETAKETKEHKTVMDLKFAFLSLAGNVLLLFYTWIAKITIFFWLTLAILIAILFEIWYSLYVRKVYKDAQR